MGILVRVLGFVGFAFGFCGVGSFCVFWVWGWVVVVLA